VPAGGQVEARLTLTPRRRGRLALTGSTLARRDPLGLMRALRIVPSPATMLILPRRYPLPPLALGGGRRYQRGGIALASSVGDSEEFAALRDYRPGDPLKRIHWRSLARIRRRRSRRRCRWRRPSPARWARRNRCWTCSSSGSRPTASPPGAAWATSTDC